MSLKSILILILSSSIVLSVGCSQSKKSDGLDLRDRIKKITLDNGIKVLMLKRDGAPVFSTEIKLRVGNIEEQKGSYGLAHFFEHMAFKGTQTIGTTDYVQEKKILDQIFEVGTKAVKLRMAGGDQQEIESLIKKRQELEKEQSKYVVKNEFTQIYQENGGINLNATTSNDFTTYYVSLPVNKLEMWAYMESMRFKKPVMRDFFTEVDVVAEERRMRVDNSPVGKLYEAYVDLAFDKSPYKTMVIGPAKDIQNYTPDVAQKFYEDFYIPSRMIIAVVGNIDYADTERIMRKHFSSIPAKPDNHKQFAGENFTPEFFPRENTITGPEKPRFYFGYHRPAHPDPDDIVMDVIKDVLCDGRTSRLFKELVLEQKIASFAGCYTSIPGSRLDALFTFYALPLKGVPNKSLKKQIQILIDQLTVEGPTTRELQKVKNKIDADLIFSLQSNSGLASQLAFYESLDGDWQYIYRLQDRIHQINADDVKRVMKKYFVKEREVTVYYEQEQS
ncbi:hypothetical protein BVY03_02000 [bacterium K02(2017)]|nr:hypothetical protein BVY03_02000 [bacterium K02(2017)]